MSNFSPWHFHRIFSKLQGESVQEHIRRLRLEKAAYELKISNYPILEIAMEAGYKSNEAFTKAFRKVFAQTPKEFRNQTRRRKYSDWKVSETPEGIDLREIYKKEIAPIKIVYVRRHGSYEEYPGPKPDSSEVKTLLDFLYSNDSSENNHQWIGVSQDDPEITVSEKIRFDLGVTIGSEEFLKTENLGKQTITGGKYCVIRHRGDYEKLPKVYSFLLNHWALDQKMILRNSPPFEVYLDPFQKKFKNRVTDIYIPIQK
nr:GyrI-like domain-containing protein [Leptospira ainlahdjerensis]